MALIQALIQPVITLLLVLYTARRIHTYLRLRHIPGPRAARVSNLPHRWHMLRYDEHAWFAALSKRHGPLVVAAPNLVVTASPALWQRVNTRAGYKRGDWFYHACRFECGGRDNVFTQTDNALHDARRKQMGPGYSGREVEQLDEAIDTLVSQFIALLRTRYLSSTTHVTPVNIGQKLQYLTLDVVGAIGLGGAFGLLATDSDPLGMLPALDQGLKYGIRALATGFWRVASLPLIDRLLLPSARDSHGFGALMATVYARVDARCAAPDALPADMAASFLRHGLTRAELRSEAVEQILAGSGTTATALQVAVLYLACNARVVQALRCEIDAAVRRHGPDAGVVSTAQARALPYLQAVVREVMRLWPPVASPFPRVVPPAGDHVVVDGKPYHLPAGMHVAYSSWAMHHSPDIYGPDADAFRPERWLEPDEAKLAAMVRTNDLIFGHGRFSCLGKAVARIEVPKVIFELVRHFDIALLRPTAPDLWKTADCLGLFVIDSLWVQVTERASSGCEAQT